MILRVGIPTMPETDQLGPVPRSYITEQSVRWFTQQGIEVVPIPLLSNEAELRAYFTQIHGLYLQGGPSLEPHYVRLVQTLLNLAIASNKAGHFFPVWGTCHGFQMLVMLLGGVYPLDDLNAMRSKTSDLTPYNVEGARLPIHGTRIPFDARLFSHQHGITLKHFLDSRPLMETFRILATSRDRKGQIYVSAIEGLDLPFYGVQFHPEHDTTRALNWMAAFFRGELAKRKGVKPLRRQFDLAAQTPSPCPSAWQDYAHHKGVVPRCYVFEARPSKN